jgi:hypothetical protein
MFCCPTFRPIDLLSIQPWLKPIYSVYYTLPALITACGRQCTKPRQLNSILFNKQSTRRYKGLYFCTDCYRNLRDCDCAPQGPKTIPFTRSLGTPDGSQTDGRATYRPGPSPSGEPAKTICSFPEDCTATPALSGRFILPHSVPVHPNHLGFIENIQSIHSSRAETFTNKTFIE